MQPHTPENTTHTTSAPTPYSRTVMQSPTPPPPAPTTTTSSDTQASGTIKPLSAAPKKHRATPKRHVKR